MMISPESYKEFHKDESIEELIQERKELTDELAKLETIVFDKNHNDSAWHFCPGPDVRYQMTLSYLAQLCELIREKYNAEIVQGDDSTD